jgi:hypothetical protein
LTDLINARMVELEAMHCSSTAGFSIAGELVATMVKVVRSA